MQYRQFIHYTSKTYTYLLWSNNEAIIIDPVKEDLEKYITLISNLKLTLKYAIDTHIHADHVTALGDLREKTNCKTVYGKESNVPCCDVLVSDGESLDFGELQMTCLYTPGHTSDSYSFYLATEQSQSGYIFTGDTLLIRGCGRTDFQNGDAAQLYTSLHEKILTLPENTLVMPGHDYNGRIQSSVLEEKKSNLRLQLEKPKFIDFMQSLKLPNPSFMDIALPANQSCGNINS